ncbi:MAG: ISAs1 family transposase ISCysp6 [Chroococcidiopsis sp. SAG 2025]|uniref:ISAs1 family transposase n=1 Tax=Chroococcidiopsis sp. SAG 2025 TaxID=171389 RepID=UPI002936F524|nr:ISAs1 family transposase [Chroococcidiopsis sp. SAG 2025]MDV2996954.1 ISAs1 family transposase ISCysp6 [Chroococcidiopsis sp. SAG 2025]
MAKGFGEASISNKKSSKSSSIMPAIDCEQIQKQWAEYFEDLTDPRGSQGVLHPFISIVMIALLATISGAKGWEDIETYGVSHEVWLSEFLALPFGIPSADTYRRLFESISAVSFERSFKNWLSSWIGDLGAQVIPIDEKTVKGSYDRNREQSALHLVSAWASENRLFLGQVKVEDKSNEITAIPALLELLDIAGCIITIDAMGTQAEIAHRIQAQGADYVLALKANHPTLHAQIKQWFETAQAQNFNGIEHSYDVRVESGHHRREKRQVTPVSIQQMGNLYKQAHWSGLQTVIKVVRTRHLWNKTTQEVMFYLSSLPPDAQQLGKATRQHWSIENQLHWVLDVTFGEDACHIRTGNAPENLALLKRWSINLLNQETSFKRSTRQKAKRASMDVRYLLTVLNASIPFNSNPSGS